MLKIEKLKKAGCDVESALKRCADDKDFYLELVESALEESRYTKMKEQISSKDWKGAFESAHALKGIVSNLSLDPMTKIAVELTELLRPQKACSCQPLMEKLLEARKQLISE